jgi:hypothetical protein
VATFVISESNLANLPLGLSRLRIRAGSGLGLRALKSLLLDHLVQPDYKGLDLGLLTAQRHRPPGAGGEEEKAPLAGVSDRRDGDPIDRVELEDRHELKTRGGGWLF